MKFNWMRMGLVLGLICMIGCGAKIPAPAGELDMLHSYTDEEGDGYPDIPAPEGVDESEVVRLSVKNEITYSQAESLAGVAIPDMVSNTVGVTCKLNVEIDYGNGVTDTLTGTRHMGAFEEKLEVVCPVSISCSVTVVADVPVVGQQTITSFGPYEFSREGQGYNFDCNTEISIETYIDEQGNVQADINIQQIETEE